MHSPIILVSVDKVQLPASLQRRVLTLSITFKEGKGDTGKLTLLDPDMELFDARVFQEGRKLSFIFGWDDDFGARGPYPIKKIAPSLPSDGEIVLSVEFQDETQRINKCQKQQKHVDIAPHELIKRIAKAHGLGYDIDSIRNVRFTDDEPLIQANQTDAKLIHRLALKYGYVWGIEGGVLYFRKQDSLKVRGQQKNVRVLSYRINDQSIESFSPEISMQENKKKKTATAKTTNVDLDTGKTFKDILNRARAKNGKFDVDFITRIGNMPAAEREAAIGEMTSYLEGAVSVPTEAPAADSYGSGQDGPMSMIDEDPETPTIPDTDGGGTGPKDMTELEGLTEGLFGKFKVQPDGSPPPGAEPEQKNNEPFTSEPGDESGAATPASEDQCVQRAPAKLGPMYEVVKAKVKLSVGDVNWRPGYETIIAGVGERLSGLYKVEGMQQDVNSDSFDTSLEVIKRKYMYGKEELSQMNTAAQQSKLGAAYQQPPEVSPVEESIMDEEMGQSVALVDGEEG